MAGPREMTRAPSAPPGLPSPEPAAVAGEASGALRGPRPPLYLNGRRVLQRLPDGMAPAYLRLGLGRWRWMRWRWRDGAATDREGL
jgi:hypothetical protein